jgi:hypothetical protein
MQCHFCELIHVLGPYALVAFFSVFIYRLVKKHQEDLAQLQFRTLNVFERQTSVYERVHLDLVSSKKDEKKEEPKKEESHGRGEAEPHKHR